MRAADLDHCRKCNNMIGDCICSSPTLVVEALIRNRPDWIRVAEREGLIQDVVIGEDGTRYRITAEKLSEPSQ